MKTLSHKYLAEHIAGQYLRGFSMLEKNAYIYGAIAPDVNKVTYLHGWKGNKKFFGHNYENSSQTMDHLIKKTGTVDAGWRDLFLPSGQVDPLHRRQFYPCAQWLFYRQSCRACAVWKCFAQMPVRTDPISKDGLTYLWCQGPAWASWYLRRPVPIPRDRSFIYFIHGLGSDFMLCWQAAIRRQDLMGSSDMERTPAPTILQTVYNLLTKRR